MATPIQTPSNHNILLVKVRDRLKTLYDGEAYFVESYNDKGDFAILGEHINFISLIKGSITIGKTDNTKVKIDLPDQAVIKVNQNIVEIYLGLSSNTQKTNQQPL